MSREMMSGPEPGALPMISRIGLSGKADSAACAPGTASSAAASQAIVPVFMCSLLACWNKALLHLRFEQRLDARLRLPVVRAFQEFAVRVVDRLAVGAELALVAVHDDVEHLFQG